MSLTKQKLNTSLPKAVSKKKSWKHSMSSTIPLPGEHSTLLASNIANLKKFEIKTPDITIQVNPECADLVETRIIDGHKCLVIVVDDRVEINGISAKTAVSGGLPKSSTLMHLMNPKAIHPKMKWMFHSKCLTYYYKRHFY